jgi:uncharacterized phage protein (TIGR02218 family)
MKLASPALQAYLGSNANLIFADLWIFTLKNGTVMRYCSWDRDLTIDGNLYPSGDVLIVGGKFKQVRGLEANETEVTCYPNLGTKPSLIGNIPFLTAARQGIFDRAIAERLRVFMPTPGDVSLGTVRVFLGEVTDIDPITRNTCILKCKDATNLLNIYMPRRQYQPTCSWTFGDSNCGVDKAALSASSVAGEGSSYTTILCALAQTAGHFNFGTVTFTSGNNKGISRSVLTYSPGAITLTGPFPQPLVPGDQFTVAPGCSKTFAGATQSFDGGASYGNTPQLIYSSINAPAGFYNGATLTFLSGGNQSQSQTVELWQPGVATLAQGFTDAPLIGDQFRITTLAGASVEANVGTVLSASVIPTSMGNTDGFFNGGILQMTSGTNVGQQRTVANWQNGIAILASPLPNVPLPLDELTITTSAGNTTATCTGYNNTARFGGMPFVPVPETAW